MKCVNGYCHYLFLYIVVFIDDDYNTVYVCDIYRDAWKDDKNEKWIAATNIKSPLFCTNTPFWQPKPFQPTCNESWPIVILFLDGSKYDNGTHKKCTVNMAEPKNSYNTRNCLDKAFNGFDKNETLDWIVYIAAGFHARIQWYNDIAEALIKR